ncbi:hypothetical protein AUK40_06710 [Candidatus Wirthbacteria bacterium CG2_30_54_11]|uniref:Zinc-ribbon domain-containing protein n=1 Tax=Candidatus Wirthbacteria bacterium CG2_30_54_11 TaxID=1817892 RepID=A0A1J5IC65_9BACT|nr:MAG: hypothetical protein AUK40_06710 [Candidatus Wirthbacteria bacterium CG2_30_54_11]
MECPRCKAEVTPGKAFCAQCGQRIGMADGIRPPIAPAALRPRSPVITPAQAMPETLGAPAPVSEDQTEKKKGKGGMFLGLGLLLLLVLGIFGGVWAYRGELPVVGQFPFPELTNRIRSITSQNILDLVPQDTVMLAEINSDRESSSYTNLIALWHLFPKYKEWEQTIFTDMSDTADSTLTWDADIEPWLGNEVVAFMQSIPMTATDPALSGTSPMGFIVSSTDMDATRTFINTLVEQEKAKATTSTYKGITIIQMESQDAAADILPDPNSLLSPSTTTTDSIAGTTPSQSQIAYIDSYLVVTNTRDMMEKVIETYQSAARFSQKDGFSKIRSDLPSDALARFYVDMGAVFEAASQAPTDPTLEGTTDFLTNSALKDAYGLAGFAITAQKDGLLISSQVSYDQAKLAEAGISSTPSLFTPELIASVPGDAAFYTEGNDLRSSIQDILTTMENSNANFKDGYSAFKKQLAGFPFNFDIDADLLGWMNGRYAVALAPEGDTFSISIIFTIEDQEAVSANLDKLRGMLQTLIYPQFAADTASPPSVESLFTQQTIAGVDVWTLDYPNLPEYAKVSYAFVGSRLVLTNTPQTIANYGAVEAGTAASLSAKPLFTSLLDRFPGEMTSISYLNPEPLWTITRALYTVMPEATDAPVDISMWEQDLAPLHGIMGISTTDQDLEKGEIFISIQK